MLLHVRCVAVVFKTEVSPEVEDPTQSFKSVSYSCIDAKLSMTLLYRVTSIEDTLASGASSVPRN